MRSRPRILCQRPKSRTKLDSCRSPAAGYFVCCNHVAEHVSHVVTSYTVRPLPFLFGLHPAFLRRRGQDSSPAPAREVPLLTRRAPTSHGVAPRVCKGNKSSGQRPGASTPPGKQICKPRRRTNSPSLNARWNCPNPRSAYLLRSAESRCSACSNLLAASGVLKSPVRISRLVAS
jgi:hypothetical protein